MQRKMHERMGNGGEFSSRSDFAGVSYNAVERDRQKQTAGYEKMFASKDDLQDAMSKVKSADEQAAEAKSSYEPSARLQNARARVGGFMSSSQQASTAGDNEEQRNIGKRTMQLAFRIHRRIWAGFPACLFVFVFVQFADA